MRTKQCLYCYNKLEAEEIDFHISCSKKIFNTEHPPELLYTEKELYKLGLQTIRSQIAITGVQPKLSLDIEKTFSPVFNQRFTIVGLWGNFILKPPTTFYQYLPENEDLTMHLAELSNIKVVPHSLIRHKSGSLAYITRRIDREKKEKIPMEDMCQIIGKLSEQKYIGSYEQIGKAIKNYSNNPGLDIITFIDILVFSFLTGNSDMHLKNFSLIKDKEIGYILSPAYDLVSTAMVIKKDKEELALTLNGKKKKIILNDFIKVSETLEINSKSVENIFSKYRKVIPKMINFIDKSYLPAEMKTGYKELIARKAKQLSFV